MELNAPEKIYIPTVLAANTVRYKEEGSIEYVRYDAFIEKACEWLTDNLTNYYLNPVILNDVIHDFKQAMKGE